MPPCVCCSTTFRLALFGGTCGPFSSSPAVFSTQCFVLSGFVFRGPFWCFGSHSMSHSLPYLQVWLFSPARFCFFNPCTDNALHCQLTAVLVTPGTLGVPLPLKLWFLTVYPAPVPCLRSQTNIQIHPPKTKAPTGKAVPATRPEAGTCYPGHCVFPFSFHHSPPFFQAAPGLRLCRHLCLPSALSVCAGTRFPWPF